MNVHVTARESQRVSLKLGSRAVLTAREHGCHFGQPGRVGNPCYCRRPASRKNTTSLTIARTDLDGPCSRVSKTTPVFTAHKHGP